MNPSFPHPPPHPTLSNPPKFNHRTSKNRNASSLSISIPISPNRISTPESKLYSIDDAHEPPTQSTSYPKSTSYYYYNAPKTSINQNFEVMPAENPYPNGPILIKEPNIYLYSEPTAEIASQFDVIINVAKEVMNPFLVGYERRDGDLSNENSPSESSSNDRDSMSDDSYDRDNNGSIATTSDSTSYSNYPTNPTNNPTNHPTSSQLHFSISPPNPPFLKDHFFSCSPTSTSTNDDSCFSPIIENSPPSSVNSTPNLYDELQSDDDDITLKKGISDDDSSLPSSQSASNPQSPVPSVSTLQPTPHSHHPPEYIYIPWDHTSKLTPDLTRLTDLILNRASQGKKILVHCQCGVSRSASLLVAYIMRVDKTDLNTAYDYVKKKSPNISPNMTLMFQLIDWARMLRNSPSNPHLALNIPSTTSSPQSSYDDDLLPSASSNYSLASPPPTTPLKPTP